MPCQPMDNGTEFARHSLLKDALGLATYFCDAYASWQKGGIENAPSRQIAAQSPAGP